MSGPAATLPAMVDGKHRRPTGMRADVPAFDDYGDIATFEYREDATAAGAALVARGWIVTPQYVGRWDRWMLYRKRRSWGYRKAEQPVAAAELAA